MRQLLRPMNLNYAFSSLGKAVVSSACFALIAGSPLLRPVNAATYSFQGKCAFLLQNVANENCTALFKDDILTLMPKGGRQVRVLPQQIVSIDYADKSSMMMDKDLELYNNMVPWWMPWAKAPRWVKKANTTKVERHEFVIRYVDRNFSPQLALFVLNDPSKASSMASELVASSELAIGTSRTASNALSTRLSSRLYSETNRQASRLMQLCQYEMFDDAGPIADALDAWTKNTIEEISIFEGATTVEDRILKISNRAIDYCDAQIYAEQQRELEKIRRQREVERQRRLAKVRQAQAAERAKLQAARQRAIDAWNSLAGS